MVANERNDKQWKQASNNGFNGKWVSFQFRREMAPERRKREGSAAMPGSGFGLWSAVLLLFAVSGAGQGN